MARLKHSAITSYMKSFMSHALYLRLLTNEPTTHTFTYLICKNANEILLLILLLLLLLTIISLVIQTHMYLLFA